MKKTLVLLLSIMLLVSGIPVFADEGESSFFGGISEGTKLPRSIDNYVTTKPAKTITLQYKEVVFLTGKPIVLEGTIKIKKDTKKLAKDLTGNYKEKYQIKASNVNEDAKLTRTVELNTSFRKIEKEFGNQINRSSTISKWKEKITIAGTTYEIDDDFSTFSKSSVEDLTPGISYYDSDVTYQAVYRFGTGEKVVVDSYNEIYGYKQPWSKIESHKQTMYIDYQGSEKKWQMEVTLTPSMSSSKNIYYDQTNPYAISFDGTFNQITERASTLTYNIKTNHPELSEQQKNGAITITTANDVEKLPIPKGLDFLKGHWGEQDIKQLYSLEIFDNLPHSNMQFEAMTRGEYITALCKALNLDISTYTNTKKTQPTVFNDVPPSHPLYPYIMTAYNEKLIKGYGKVFGIYQPIRREEAFVICIRIIGLERLGVTENPITPFVDHYQISEWARKEIMAGYNLGIIKGNNGKLLPSKYITQVESGTIINRLIKYLRYDIQKDYAQ